MIPIPPYKLAFDEEWCENIILDSENRQIFVCKFNDFSDAFEEDEFLEKVVESLNNLYTK